METAVTSRRNARPSRYEMRGLCHPNRVSTSGAKRVTCYVGGPQPGRSEIRSVDKPMPDVADDLTLTCRRHKTDSVAEQVQQPNTAKKWPKRNELD